MNRYTATTFVSALALTAAAASASLPLEGVALPFGDPIFADVDTSLDHTSPQPAIIDDGENANSAPGFTPQGGPVETPILDPVSMQLSWQALLRDNGGNPLAGPVNLTFNIYTSPGGALVQGPINVNGVALVDGVASVRIPVSAGSFNGSGRELGVRVNGGVELTPRTILTSVPYAMRVDRVTSEELDDTIDLGNASTSGNLNIWNGGFGTQGIQAFGNAAQISTYGSDGFEQIRLWGTGYGELLLNDFTDNTNTVVLSAQSNSGGQLQLRDGPTGGARFSATAPVTGGQVTLFDSANGSTFLLSGDTGSASAEDGFYVVNSIGGSTYGRFSGSASGSTLTTLDETGATTMIAGTSGSVGGFINLYQADGGVGAILDGDAGTDSGGALTLYQTDGSSGVFIDGDQTGADGGGNVYIYNPSGFFNIQLDGDDGDNGGRITIRDGVRETIRLDGSGSGGGAGLNMFNSNGDPTFAIDADSADASTLFMYNSAASYRIFADGESATGGGLLQLRDADGTTTVSIDAAESSTQGACIALRDAAGVTTITIDGDFNGDGRVTTEELAITGGSDLSEQFDVAGDIQPGEVVCIDPVNPGKLVRSSRAYDACVAGIVSGAGGIKPGMLMGQKGSVADGEHPIALTGRVYVQCNASNGKILPGDMLTTSDIAGQAMKATDRDLSFGTIIGKAMTTLEGDEGLVLILVNLQ